MPADTEVAGLSVVVSAEVAQATKALEGMSKQFENTALVAQQATDVQEASFTKTGKGMDDDLKQHKKHSAGVMAALKKIGGVWAAITGAATAGIYALLRASSYGSLYFSQWGATTKDLANTAIKPLIPALNDATNAYKNFAETTKKEGIWAAIKKSGTELVTWLGEHLGITGAIGDATNAYETFKKNVKDKGIVEALKISASEFDTWYKNQNTITKVTIGLIAALTLAVGALILLFTGPVGLVVAIAAVGVALLAAFKWDWIKTNVSNLITYLKNITWPEISNPFAGITWCSVIPGWVASILGICDDQAETPTITWPHIDNPFDFGTGESSWISVLPSWVQMVLGIGNYIWNVSWPNIDNPFAGVKWCSIIPGWVASVLGICDDTAVAPVVTWPGIPDPFANVFDTITDFAGDAADVGGTLIDNLVSGINTGMPSLSDAVSGITDTLSGIGSGSSGGGNGSSGGNGGGGYWVPNNDLSVAQKNALSQQYMNNELTYDEYYAATHTWVGGTGGETTPEVSPIPSGTITKIWSYSSSDWGQDENGNWGYQTGWGTYQISSNGGEEEGRYGTGPLIDFIYGKKLLQSVFDSMTEQQQQNWMDSHGAIIDDITHELTQQYAMGGYVPSTSAALVHEGEYVVPRSGTLVKEGGIPDITINLTVNNGTQKDSRMLADEISRILSTEIRRLVKT